LPKVGSGGQATHLGRDARGLISGHDSSPAC
jgi:hypothetical protein